MRHWEEIADNLSKVRLELGLDLNSGFWGVMIWIAEAHRGDGKRFTSKPEEAARRAGA
jgi:hypothetical protein